MPPIKSLEHRIADAFEAPKKYSSEELAKLLSEVQTAATDSAKAKEDADALAMNPATRPEAVREARSASEDASFRASRMAKAVEGLEALIKDAKGREAAARAEQERADALRECEELAKDLAEWGELTTKMVDLLTRLSRNNRRLGTDPTGQGRRTAEAIVRGIEAIPINNGFTPASIISGTRLITFNGSPSWPPVNQNNWVDYP